jgi:hypothetical protein
MSCTRKALEAVLVMVFVAVPNLAEDHPIFYGRQVRAERFTVVEGGGYFPVLIQLDNKDLLAVVRGGDRHLGVKGRLDVVRSTDAGKTWSLKTLVDSPWDDRNPAVGQLKDGTILVTYIVNKSYGPHGEYLKDNLTVDGLYTMRSRDRGNTWEGPIKSPIAPEYGESPYGKIAQLADGTALLNVYYGKNPHLASLVYRSRDDGQTWGDPSVIAKNYNEASLLVLSENRILAVMRSESGGHLATAFSTDQGRTWSEPRQVTRDREHPADVIRLSDGRLLLVYGERNRPFGARAMLSRDLGETWDSNILILAADAQLPDCGYPSSVEIAPGKVVTLYYGVDEIKDTPPEVRTLRGIYARAIAWTVPD